MPRVIVFTVIQVNLIYIKSFQQLFHVEQNKKFALIKPQIPLFLYIFEKLIITTPPRSGGVVMF